MSPLKKKTNKTTTNKQKHPKPQNKKRKQTPQPSKKKKSKFDNMTWENSILFQYPLATTWKDQLINCLLF